MRHTTHLWQKQVEVSSSSTLQGTRKGHFSRIAAARWRVVECPMSETLPNGIVRPLSSSIACTLAEMLLPMLVYQSIRHKSTY